MDKNSLKKLSKFIPIIGITLFIYIIYNIGVEKIAHTFTLIPIQYYFLAFLPFFLRWILTAYKWQYLWKKQKKDFKLTYLMKIFLIGTFYGNVTPGGIGSYIRILYFRKKSGASIEKCITNTVLDATTGFIVGFFIALIGSIVLIDIFPGLFPIILLFLIFYTLAFVFFMRKSGGRKFFRFFIRPFIPGKFKDRFDKSVESLYEDIPRLRDIIIPFIIEIGIWIIITFQVYIIALAFPADMPLSFLMFFLLSVISVVAVSILPISFGGLGVREGSFIYLLFAFGVKQEIAFVISLSGYIVKMLIPAFIGMFLSLKKENKIF